MSVKLQKQLAAKIAKAGIDRVWVDPEKTEKVESAITRDEVKKLIHEGLIKILPKKGISGGRKKKVKEKKARGKRKGPGSKKGSRISGKTVWIKKIRPIRAELKGLRDNRRIARSTYRKLFAMAKGGAFKSVSHLKEYIKAHRLTRKR
ncbi:MAG: 50S ribosomal protein L19e [Candidatus Bathyarchaeia archaeon]